MVHTRVTVTLGHGCAFEAVIRRILPSDEVGWAYFGLEFTSITPAFGDWLDHILETQRSTQRS